MNKKLLRIEIILAVIVLVASWAMIFKLSTLGKPQNEVPPTANISIEVEGVSISGQAPCGYLVNFGVNTIEGMPPETTMIIFVDASNQRDNSIGVILPLNTACWGNDFQSGQLMTPTFFAGSAENLSLIGTGNPIWVELKINSTPTPGTEGRPSSQSQA